MGEQEERRWCVAYTAPGSRGGVLTVRASSHSGALDAARAMHRRTTALHHGTDVRHKLTVRELSRITYGQAWEA